MVRHLAEGYKSYGSDNTDFDMSLSENSGLLWLNNLGDYPGILNSISFTCVHAYAGWMYNHMYAIIAYKTDIKFVLPKVC